jgi:hypothetical protein
MYDKTRWPTYRDLVYRRKNNMILPINSKQVPKTIGVQNAKEASKQLKY